MLTWVSFTLKQVRGLMTNWLRRVLGTLALGGSTLGCFIVITTLFTEQTLASRAILLLFFPLYVWGVWCGIQMLERHEDAMRTNSYFWAIQVPIVQSSVFSYAFSSGMLGGAWFQFTPAKINFLGWLGSRFEFGVNQDKPLALGLNFVALAVFLFLWRNRNAAPSNNSFNPMPLRGTG
jgi:hypothetical protein